MSRSGRVFLFLVTISSAGCAGHAQPTTSFGAEECRNISLNESVVSSLSEGDGLQLGFYGECWKFSRIAFSAKMDVTIQVQSDGFAPEVSLVERRHLDRPLAGDFGRRNGTVTIHATLKNNTQYNILVVSHPEGATGDYRLTVTKD
ncbi:MAG: hypothetical protein ABI613_05320 [Gemmatimonadota bacterium]